MKKFLNKRKVASLLSSFVFLWGSQCGARDLNADPWQISADKITRYGKPVNIVAEGNVVMTRVEQGSSQPVTIEADWIRYNVEDGVVHARGNLTMRNTNEDVDAQEAVFDLNEDTATLTETTLFVPESNLHFSGHEVEKTGPITYRFVDGDFTTCKVEEGESSPWVFHSAETIVKVEKTTTLKQAVLRVKGVPVFYIPYMILPGNTKRKTGLLLPEISQSSLSGAGLITPYFIDLSPSSDITLYPGYLAKRGVVAGLELRHVFDENSKFTVAGTYIQDKTEDTVEDDYKSDDYLRTEHNRYWVRGKLDYDFGHRIKMKADLDMASDRDYLQELDRYANGFDESNDEFLLNFHRGLDEETLPYRSSQVQVTKSWSSAFLGGQFVGIDDLVEHEDRQTQINTLPRLLFDGVFELPSLPVSFSWNSEYVNYWREEGVGEQRLNLYPRLTAPLPFGRLIEGTVSAGVQETIYRIKSYGPDKYDWPHDEGQDRTAWYVNSVVGTTVARDFDMNIGSVSWVNHAIRPEIEYTYISVPEQEEIPRLDSLDQLRLTNLLTYGVNNHFRLGGEEEGKPFNRYIGYLELTQSYNIEEERRDLTGVNDKRRPFSDVTLTLNIYPLPQWQTKYSTSYNVYGNGITKYSLYSKYNSERGDSIAFDYRYQQDSEINQLNGEVKARLTDTLYFEGMLKQSLDTNEMTNGSVGLVYHPQCWAVKFLAEKDSDDKRIMLMFSMVGLGESLGIGLSGDLEGGLDMDSGSDGLDTD